MGCNVADEMDRPLRWFEKQDYVKGDPKASLKERKKTDPMEHQSDQDGCKDSFDEGCLVGRTLDQDVRCTDG